MPALPIIIDFLLSTLWNEKEEHKTSKIQSVEKYLSNKDTVEKKATDQNQ
jgi:hypothetical protein